MKPRRGKSLRGSIAMFPLGRKPFRFSFTSVRRKAGAMIRARADRANLVAMADVRAN
jgi:hypothetical protein